MSGRVLRRETVQAACGAYTGAQCPWCPAVVQPMRWNVAGEQVELDERQALERHVAVVHPERLAGP